MRISHVGALVALSALIPATAATAASPPKGNYGCSYSTFSGTFGAGQLNILSASTYRVNKKKPTSDYTTRRKRINFKNGPYRSLYGKWRKVDYVTQPGFTYQIRIFEKKNDEYRWTCERD
jgi:hypothetical protein